MARSRYDPSFNPTPTPRPIGFGPGVTSAYDAFKTGVVGAGGGAGLTYGTSVAGFDPYDFQSGPPVAGFNILPPTVSFGGPPAAPGDGFGFLNSIISGIGGFTGAGTLPIQRPRPDLIAAATGAVGPPTGAVVSPVSTDGGVGFLDSLKTMAAGLLNGIGAQSDTVEVTPVMGAQVGGSGGAGGNTAMYAGLALAAAVAFFALKK